MRLRATLALTVATTALLTPFAVPAQALTTNATRVFYTADPNDDLYFELYSMPADGSADGTPFLANGNDIAAPALSPTGDRVAYAEDVTDTLSYELRVRTTDGLGGATTVTTGADDYNPAWSRDGLTIAFERTNAVTDLPDVYTVPADGSAAPTLVAANAAAPAFSPSGHQLVVDKVNADGSPGGLDLITLGTPSTRAHVNGTGTGTGGTFSPDGHWLVFESMTITASVCRVALARVPVSGAPAATVVVGNSTSFYTSPEFTPDGTQLFASEMRNACTDTPLQDVVAAAWTDGAIAPPLAAPAIRTTTVNEVETTVTGGTFATDATAPAAPVVTATVAATSATLSWTADSDASEFVVIRKALGDPAPASPTDGTVVYHGGARSAALSGLVANTAYDAYVFAWDAAGNLSPVSTVHHLNTTPVPVLNTIPRVGVNTTGATFPVSWTGSAAAYQVLSGERPHTSSGWGSPAYHTWIASTAGKSASYAGAQGHTYYFQVRGLDVYGNPTAYTGAKSANVPLNENSAAFAYSSGWSGAGAANRYLGTYRYATAAGKYFSGRADTLSFTVLGDKCAVCGQFKVYVDGVLKATVDTKASTTYARQVLYAGPALPGGVKSHSIKIVTVGTAGRPRVDIDGIALVR
jgi:hypothetical protein